MRPAPLGGSCEGGKVSTHWQGVWWGNLRSHRGECCYRGAEGKAERFLPRGMVPMSTHQPETLFCSPAGAGGGWKLRLGLHRADPKERTEVGFMKTA